MGPGSTGVSASLIRPVRHQQRLSTAQAEVQLLGKDNKERIGTPMNFALVGNKSAWKSNWRGCEIANNPTRLRR